MEKRSKEYFANCIDPEFAYIQHCLYYMAWENAKNNPFLQILIEDDFKKFYDHGNGD